MNISERDLLTQMNPPQPSPLPWMAEKIVPSAALPGHAKPGRRLRVVAKEGYINDWTAYCHYDEYDADTVARRGDKLSAEEAVAIFPFLAAERYRP